MTLQHLARRGGKVVADNSPLILTALGVAGTVTTAVLTGKATVEAVRKIDAEEAVGGTAGDPKQRYKQRFLLVWKLYIPAAGTGLMTVTCIVLANRIGTRRTAALAAAYVTSQEMFDEYREVVKEKVGEKQEQEVRDEVATRHVREHAVEELVILNEGDVLCFDVFSDRTFPSTMEKLRAAENDVNYQLIHEGWCSLGEYYRLIGLPATAYSEEVGWNSDKKMEVSYTSCLTKSGRPALAVNFHVEPTRGFDSFH